MAKKNKNDINNIDNEVNNETVSANINDTGDGVEPADIGESSDIDGDEAESADAGESAITGDGNDDGELSDAVESSAITDDTGASDLRIMEALIFASDETLTPARLKTLIPGAPDARRLRKMAAEINEQLAEQGHPFEIVEAGGGYQFRTSAAYHAYVRKLYKERAAKKLSLQALECLAIIAYRQPISKAEVEAIRGVLSDGAMKTLLERKLVDICGRSEKPGRPLLYGTTSDFLKYFGINKISDLPKIEEFEALAKAKMEELSSEELGDEQNHIQDDGQDGGDQ